MHIVSDKSLQRPGYVYNDDGIGYPVGAEPEIVWDHIDGPLLYCRSGECHWLTWRERFLMWIGREDIESVERKYMRRGP